MSRIAEWLNQQYPDDPSLSTIKRDGRGIHHSVTGMLLCPIRYNWDDDEYKIASVLDKISAHVHELTGYAPNFVRLTLTMITPSTSAFAAFIVVSLDPATTLRKGSYRVHCL